MNATFLPFLVRLRWLAVGMVVLYHVRFLFFTSFFKLDETGPLLTLFYFLTSFGHEGYVLYMLLSGVLLGGQSYRRWHPGHPGLRHLWTRTLWFYALLIPSLAIGGMLDIFGSRVLGESGVYARFDEFSPTFDVGAFAANFLMVQRFLAPGLGSNAMLFILAYECWAYLSLAAFVLPRRRCVARLAAASIAVVGIFLAPEFGGYLVLWTIGLALARAPQWPRFSRTSASMVVVGSLLLSRFGDDLAQVPDHYVPLARLLLDLQLGLGFAVLLIAFRGRAPQRPRWGRLAFPLARRFPGAHVAIFATHFPFMMFLAAAGNLGLGVPIAGPPSPSAFFAFVGLVAAIYAYGFGFCHIAFSVSQRLRRGAGRQATATA